MILGHEKPDAGDIVVGETVVPMYVEQSRESLDGKRSEPFAQSSSLHRHCPFDHGS